MAWLSLIVAVQKEIQKKFFFNNATKYLFPLIKLAEIDFICIQNLSELLTNYNFYIFLNSIKSYKYLDTTLLLISVLIL